MPQRLNNDSQQEWERLHRQAARSHHYIRRLYVTAMTPCSQRAVQNIPRICEDHLKGRYELEIVDAYQQPVLAKGDQIVAAPTLIKRLPAPPRRFIGDMSEKEKILLGLDLSTKAKTPGPTEARQK